MENKLDYGAGLYQDGVFFFTNPGIYKNPDGTKDWSALWNNREYRFKGNTTVPLTIMGEPPENVQIIRKRFAKKYAVDCFHQSKRYAELVKKGGYIPATYDEEGENGEYTKVIQACLTPLPKSSAEIKDMPRDKESNYKASKAVRVGQDLNKVFEDYQIPELGQQ